MWEGKVLLQDTMSVLQFHPDYAAGAMGAPHTVVVMVVEQWYWWVAAVVEPNGAVAVVVVVVVAAAAEGFVVAEGTVVAEIANELLPVDAPFEHNSELQKRLAATSLDWRLHCLDGIFHHNKSGNTMDNQDSDSTSCHQRDRSNENDYCRVRSDNGDQ
jgi:hypothetical protein